MTIQEQIENIEKELAELKSKLKENKEENKRWRAENNEEYYFVNESIDIQNDTEDNYEIDDIRYRTRNYFKTEEEAKKHLEKINTYYELMDLADELNKDNPINWQNDEQAKYYIYCFQGEMRSDYNLEIKNIADIYCTNPDFFKIAKERIGEDRLIKLFK